MALITGCGTPYGAVAPGSRTGYTDSLIASDKVAVTFTGLASTGREAIHRYSLYRAAEVARSQGFRGLRVLKDTIIVMNQGHRGQVRLYQCRKEMRLMPEAEGDLVIDVDRVLGCGTVAR